MIINPKGAHNFTCCAMTGRCVGDSCMAWIKEVVTLYESDTTTHPIIPPKSYRKETGKGYCGLVYKN